MTKVAIISGLIIVMSGAIYSIYGQKEVIAVNTKVETVEVEKEVDAIEKRIADAQAEAMTSIEDLANAMRDEFIDNELKKVETQVLKEVQAELDSRVIDLEKSTGAY